MAKFFQNKISFNKKISLVAAAVIMISGFFVAAPSAFAADVANLADLQTALADVSVATINITANISAIPATLVVPVGHAVTINGGGKTLTFTGLESVVGNVDDGFMIQAPTTINDLTVDAGLVTPTSWVGTYAIQVYNTTATLNNVTAKNGNGGILVNGSAVTLTGAINVSGNGVGGIEVSASQINNLPDSALTVTGTLVNSTEAYGLPTIWLVNGQGSVTGANVPATTSTTIAAGQTQYYLTTGNSLPVMTGTVAITGTEKFGSTLTAVPSLTNAGTPTYQWKRGDSPIGGATASTYTLSSADIGLTIKVTATADGVAGTGSITSSATESIAKADGPSAPSAPTLISKTATSITLTANALNQFSKDDGSIWQDSSVFSSLTALTPYTFVARVKETSTTNASVKSVTSDTITTDAPVMGGTVSITGTEKFGATLTANLSSLTYTPTTSADVPTYQWKRDGVAIDGATASTYTLVSADITKAITVTVTADGTHATGNVTSSATGSIAKADSTTVVTCPASPETYNGSVITPCTVSVTGVGMTTLTPSPVYANNVNVGTASASYTFAGDDSHTGSSDSKNFSIAKADQVITWSDPSGITYGTALNGTQLNALSSGDGTPVYTPSAGSINAGDAQALSVTFGETANYNSATKTVHINVAKATPTATLAVSNSPVTYTGSDQSATVGITVFSTPGAVANISTGGAASKTSAGTYAVTADFVPTDTDNYNTLTGLGAGNLQIAKAGSATAITCPATPQTYTGSAQTPCTVLVTRAGSGVGSASLTPTPVYEANTNVGTASANYTYAGDTNHTGSTGSTATFPIAKATPTIVVTPYSVTYDANPHTASYTAKGVLGEDLDGMDVSDTTQTNAGDYATAPWTFTDATGNYNNANSTVHDGIGQATSATAITCPATQEYTASAITPCTVAVTGAGGLSLTPAPVYSANTAIGTANASYTFGGDANHTGSSDSKDFGIIDTTSLAPASLAVGSPTQTTLALNWTNNELNGSFYTIKRSTSPITDSNFAAATTLGGAPTVASGTQGYTANNLSPATLYYFAIKMTDVVPNVSSISFESGTTAAADAVSEDVTAPSAVTNLSLSAGPITTSQIVLNWSATGDDGTSGMATAYVIKRSTSAITSGNFDAATTVFNSISPSASSSPETLTVSGLLPSTTYYFAIKVQDEVPNTSVISNVQSLATSNNLPTVASVSPATGQNDGTHVITVTGTNFVTGTNTVRLTNADNTFDLTGTYSSATQVTATVGIGMPAGVYGIRVIDDNGTSAVYASAYTVTAAPAMPSVTDVVPSSIGTNVEATSTIEIYGTGFTGVVQDGVVLDDAAHTVLADVVVVSNTKITARIPIGTLVAGTYNIKVTNASLTNTVSAVQITVTAPVVIDSSDTQDVVTETPINMGDTSTIPVQITMNSNTEDSTLDNNTTIEVVIPPATAVTMVDDNGNTVPYTGNINPPQLVKPTDAITKKAGGDAVVITMGNLTRRLTLAKTS